MTQERSRDGEVADGGTRTVRVRRAARQMVAGVRRELTVPDVAALTVLVASTLHLVARDGGRAPREALTALVAVAIGGVILLPRLRHTSRTLTLLLAAWALGPLVAVATAEIRSGMVRPLVVAAFVPTVVLATIHLWRRPWGPRALGLVLLLATARSWYGTFLAWWGGSTGRPTWLALSWHNQSGTLMGAFAVAATAVAALVAGRLRVLLLVLAGACLAGAWASGSRGAVVATAIGMLAALVGALRGRAPWRTVAATFLAVVALGGVAVVGLEAMVAGDAGQPLTNRSESAGQNLAARFGHWEAAAGMAASRPLTGWGPGSYRWASLDHYPSDTNLTASAHNEYLEVLGESGIVGAAPVWFAATAIAWFAAVALWRAETGRRSGARRAGVLAAASAATVLGSHAAIDFDWDYPLLLVLFAVAGAVLWAERAPAEVAGPPRGVGRGWLVVTSVAVVAGLAAGIAAAGIRPNPEPWNLDGQLSSAVGAAERGDIDAARATLDTVRSWNPGSGSLTVVTAVVDHRAGDLGDAELGEVVGPEHASSSDRILVARTLLEAGATDEASGVLDDLATTLEGRRRWGGRDPATIVAGLQLSVAAARGGCASAESLAPDAVAWAATFGAEPEHVVGVFARTSPVSGCDL